MIRLASALVSAIVLLACPAVAAAQSYMPGQEEMDQPGHSMTNGNWSDMPGGATARPYIKSLTVINGASSVQVFSGGVTAATGVQVGDVTAVVSPVNLCRAGQAPTQGQCYSTPNRVAIAFGYKSATGFTRDFKGATGLRETVDEDTVFDVVIGLNTLGRTLRWAWANGELVDWKTTNLGTDAAEIRVRIKPSVTPNIDWGRQPNAFGCTATPIRDCDLARADGSLLTSEMVLSLDETLSPALTGAVFATEGAVAGFLEPGGSPTAPTLDLQMASAHLAADGSPQRGTLRAFLPAQGLLGLYGVLPADASTFFTATRRGSAGTQDAPRFEARTASETSSEGLLVTVDNVTFSAPTYRVARKAAAVRVRSTVRGRTTALSTAALAACRRRACTVTVYKTAGELAGRASKVAAGRTDARGAAVVQVGAGRLARRSTYIVAIRRAGKLVTSARGVVR
jgi:hypothetical protein